jgi:hypothetical protein
MNFIRRISSRKFIVWVVATVALFMDIITGIQWVFVSAIWIGGNSIDKLIAFKGGCNAKKNDE